MSNAKTAAALVGGYVLGRTKKAKFAISVGLWLTGRNYRARDLVRGHAVKFLRSAEGEELLGQLRGPAAEAGRHAAVALYEAQVDRLADRLAQRTEQLSAGLDSARRTAGKTAQAGGAAAGRAAAEGATAARDTAGGAAGAAAEGATAAGGAASSAVSGLTAALRTATDTTRQVDEAEPAEHEPAEHNADRNHDAGRNSGAGRNSEPAEVTAGSGQERGPSGRSAGPRRAVRRRTEPVGSAPAHH